MPTLNLPIQNINDSHIGFLFGSGNSCHSTVETATYPYICGKGNGISGRDSFIAGQANKIHDNGHFSTIFGVNNDATGQFVFIHGASNDVCNNVGTGASIAIGHNNYISGENNYAIGCNNVITAGDGVNNNFVFGNGNNITGLENITFGGGNDISGFRNFVYGHLGGPGDSVTGSYNIAFGNNAYLEISGNYNILAGQNSYVTGNNSVLIGSDLKFDSRNNPAITIFGQYNETTAYGTGSPFIFLVANGQDDDTRSDAFTINLNGETSAKDFIDENGKKLSETLPIHLVATVAEATAGYVNGHVYIVTGSNS